MNSKLVPYVSFEPGMHKGLSGGDLDHDVKKIVWFISKVGKITVSIKCEASKGIYFLS